MFSESGISIDGITYLTLVVDIPRVWESFSGSVVGDPSGSAVNDLSLTSLSTAGVWGNVVDVNNLCLTSVTATIAVIEENFVRVHAVLCFVCWFVFVER